GWFDSIAAPLAGLRMVVRLVSGPEPVRKASGVVSTNRAQRATKQGHGWPPSNTGRKCVRAVAPGARPAGDARPLQADITLIPADNTGVSTVPAARDTRQWFKHP